MSPRCEICERPVGRVDAEGICVRCWRDGIAFAADWIEDLRVRGFVEEAIVAVVDSEPRMVRALHAHVVLGAGGVAYAGRDAGVPMRRSAAL